MPVDILLVEGELDSVIMRALCAGNPLVEIGGSKFGLAERVLALQQYAGRRALALRDRDFDFDPPSTMDKPEKWMRNEAHLGYYWSRHEMENFLLLPKLADRAMMHRSNWELSQYEKALRDAAQHIMYYESARWALGATRRSLPRRLQDRYDEKHDDTLPADLSKNTCRDWAVETGKQFASDMFQNVGGQMLADKFESYRDRFRHDTFWESSAYLQWFSGKDVLSALEPWIKSSQLADNRGHWKALLRDWIDDNADAARSLVPEWECVVSLLQAS